MKHLGTSATADDIAKQSQLGGGGGGGAGAGLSATLTVDFGTGGASAARRKTFDVAMAGAVVGQKVQASASLDMPAGLSADEYEMDPFVAAGQVVQANQVRLTVASLGAPLSRQRRIHVSLT
jgi:hypothetical protein